MTYSLDGVGDLLADEIDEIAGIIAEVTDQELLYGTGCQGWRVADLVVHIRDNLADMSEAAWSVVDEPADRDFVTYWEDWPNVGAPTFADVRWTWAQAASYATAEGLRDHFANSAAAAALAARNAPPGNRVFQGHVADFSDIMGMWVTELTLHHLDLVVNLPGRPGPVPGTLDVVVATLDGILGPGRPPAWDDETYAKKGTGRLALDDTDRAELGSTSKRYPAFG